MSARRVDVAIIGGGTAGCAAALALRARGMTVTLLEKGLCGSQASGVNFGGVRRNGRAHVELPLAARARAIWDRLPGIVGEDCEFRATGHLKLARCESDMAALEDHARGAREFGFEPAILGANAARDLCPWLGVKVVGAALAPDDGQANPRLVAPAFARAARRAGAEIREQTRVTGARWTGGEFELDAGDATLRAGRLVNVGGFWGGEVAAWFGEPVPIEAITPNLLVSEPLPFFMTRSLGVCGGDVYARQVERGNVIFGGGHGWGDPDRERARPLSEVSRDAMARVLDIVPALRAASVIRSWTGFDGKMPDEIPVIGASSTTPGLVHAFGFSGHGFQLGPAIGEIVAELVSEGRTPSPIAPFAIERFTSGARPVRAA
jgi:sarcosine oxidase subunit beta